MAEDVIHFRRGSLSLRGFIAVTGFLLIFPLFAAQSSEIDTRYVDEPEFESSIYILQAGKEHRDSVILVHGLGNAGTEDWKHVIPFLSKRFHVIALDLPGFAKSEKGNHLYSPTRYARLLKWVIDHFSSYRNGKPVFMVGHSMGGAIALRYASLYPETLKKLVLVDVAGILHRSAFATASLKNATSFSDRFALFGSSPQQVELLLGDLIIASEGFPQPINAILGSSFFRGLLLRSNPSVIAALALLQEDFGTAIDTVGTPTAIIWGEDDNVAPLRVGKLLSARMSHARLDTLSDVGHVPMRDATNLFNRLLLKRLTNRLPKKAKAKDSQSIKDFVCRSKKGIHIFGAYRNISISQCTGVVMEDVDAKEIQIEDSEVDIYNSRFRSNDTGMIVKNSVVTATALDIDAKTAISIYASKLDLAGVNILCEKGAIHFSGGDNSVVQISVSKIQGEYLHTVYGLAKPSDSMPCRTGE